MKKILHLSLLILLPAAFLFSACKKKEGCMDVKAVNYDDEAKKDDGSCIYSSEEEPVDEEPKVSIQEPAESSELNAP